MPRFRANPNFDLTPDQQAAEWERMRREPRPLERPLVVLAGYHSPLVTSRLVAQNLCTLTSGVPSSVHAIAYPFAINIASAADRTMSEIQQRFPSSDPEQTRELDVVGISMGGLVARYAAAARVKNGRTSPRLNIRRLFTIATPHRGAKIARVVAVDRAAHEMVQGSSFLFQLDQDFAQRSYELVCYAQLRDWWVGATNAAPPGLTPYWTDTRGLLAFTLSHFAVNSNRALLLDLARRLRGESPIARDGAGPPTD